MEFVFSEPFSSAIGKYISIEIGDPTPLRILVTRLPAEIQTAVAGCGPWSEDRVLARVLFFREGRIVGLGDPVVNSDIIKVMLAVTGG